MPFYSVTDKVLMSLGGFKFEITKTAYSNLTRRARYRWSELKSLGAGSSMHFTGIDKDEISLDGSIFPQHAGQDGYEAFNKIRTEADKGEPIVMVDGLGKNHGKWVILGIEKRESSYHANSMPRRIDFNISLKAYE